MTITAWCSDPRHHKAFGFHQRGPEGLYCTTCGLGAAAPVGAGSGAGNGTEANSPSPTPQVDPDPTVRATIDSTAEPTTTPSIDPSSADPEQGQPPFPAPDAPPLYVGQSRYRKQRRPKPCGHCGTDFIPTRSGHDYCKVSCKSAAFNMRKRIKQAAREGRYYKPQMRRPALAGLIGRKPYQIPPPDKESGD